MYLTLWLSGGTSLKTLVGNFFSYRLKNIGMIFFFLPTKNKLVGNFLLLLKSNGIKTFLINDNNVIIKKLKYDLKMFKK